MNNGQTETRINEIKSDLESLDLNIQILINSLKGIYNITNDKDVEKISEKLNNCLKNIKESSKEIEQSLKFLNY